MGETLVSVNADDFPQQLKKLRQEKHITQKELAGKAGVTQQTISAIEQGKLDPSLKLLIAIATILGIALLISLTKKNGGEIHD